jgi:hypothetical protein
MVLLPWILTLFLRDCSGCLVSTIASARLDDNCPHPIFLNFLE